MITYKNLYDNDNLNVIDEKGQFKVFEYKKDLSVNIENAVTAYFGAEMNIRKRQVLVELNDSAAVLQAGAMQWMSGNVNATSGIKGIGDFFGKALKSKVTSESAIKPEYKGTGLIMLEPTYKHLILLDVDEWGEVVLEDALFLACEAKLKHSVVARSNLSSAVLGGEGLFNLCLSGSGIACIESPVPETELIEFDLKDDILKIDGNMAIAWSNSLKFTVERSGKTLIGSGVSGEGLVNVYRGTGKVLMAPIVK